MKVVLVSGGDGGVVRSSPWPFLLEVERDCGCLVRVKLMHGS